jgi:myo-inositol 2-dehydrogenase / D-chiro-inositol 1-dehydrogenase
MNFAFYGAGPRAQRYLQALAHRPDVALAGVCDPDPRAAEATAAGWRAKIYPSCETMLEEARPDALCICIAPQLQADAVAQATKRNIPFFIEPPGAIDYDHARVYAGQIARSRLVTAVGFTIRYADVVQEAREYLGTNPVPLALGWWLEPMEDAVAVGWAGEADHGTLSLSHGAQAIPGARASTPLSASQFLWAEGCRLVDALRLFCGEVHRVRALSADAGTAAGGLVVQMEFAGGGVGVLTCATFARPEPRMELEFMGDGWSLAFVDRFATLRLAERDKTTILRCLNDPSAQHVTAFLAAVEAGDPAAVAASYSDALHTLTVCHAVIVSIREGRPVTIAEVEEGKESVVRSP